MIHDLFSVTLATFLPYVGQYFWLHVPGLPQPLQAVLMSAQPSPYNEINATRKIISPIDFLRKEAFMLIFLGPKEIILPQGNYTFEHQTLGRFALDISPIGVDQRGVHYQAIFN